MIPVKINKVDKVTNISCAEEILKYQQMEKLYEKYRLMANVLWAKHYNTWIELSRIKEKLRNLDLEIKNIK